MPGRSALPPGRAVPAPRRTRYFDLWNGIELHPHAGRLVGGIDLLGAILAIDAERVDDALLSLLEEQRREAARPDGGDTRNFLHDVTQALPVKRTPPQATTAPPPGMVYVPGGVLSATLTHARRESGCYPDPGTPREEWKRFLWGDGEPISHHVGPLEIAPFFMDEAEVTNAQYEQFLLQSGYRPRCEVNFVKHWRRRPIPEETADLPVVYVDLEDARAYAAWAGKRLPTEAEWQWAAQGPEGRAWPWGDAAPGLETRPTQRQPPAPRELMPAHSWPEGRTPLGIYNLAGNVWEWTESQRDDGHCRWCIIRGGSYYQASGSNWYTPGGPQPNSTHTKFLLLWPGLDRCATVGFRCVVDAR